MQGDYLPHCLVPVVPADFRPGAQARVTSVPVYEFDLIVLTQSCDLANTKTPFVLLCAVDSLERLRSTKPSYRSQHMMDRLRTGGVYGLHLLPSPEDPEADEQSLVANFYGTHVLPYQYVVQRALDLGPRWRLAAPHCQKLSGRFAYLFTRPANE